MSIIITRAVHIGACVVLLSVFAFQIFIAKSGLGQADQCALQESEALRRLFRRLAIWSLVAAFASGIGWFWIVLAQMTGRGFWEMPSMEAIEVAITQTQFGELWEWRLGLMLLFIIVHLFGSEKWRIFLWNSRAWQCLGAVVATTLLASLAWAGHAGAALGGQRWFHLTADAAHLVAAGLWPGGLVPLTFFLVRAGRLNQPSLLMAAGTIARRFSALSLFVVGALATTGFVNSYFLVGSVRALVLTRYGRLLALKLLLFFIMISLGAWNRLRLNPQLASVDELDDQQSVTLCKLKRNVVAELCLGTLIVVIVGALGISPLPRLRGGISLHF